MKADIYTNQNSNNSDDDDDDDTVWSESGTAFINVNGPLVRGTGMNDTLCNLCGVCELDNLDQLLMAARDNPDVSRIILIFNSPGGVSHSLSTALLIQQIAMEKDVIGYVPSTCCSAAYELASACSELYCGPTAWLGFVGVIYARADVTEMNGQLGIGYTFITSSPKKLYLNPNAKITPEEKEWIEQSVEYSYNQFKDLVLSNRDIDPKYLDSSIFIGEQAVKLNFADGIKNNLEELSMQNSQTISQ